MHVLYECTRGSILTCVNPSGVKLPDWIEARLGRGGTERPSHADVLRRGLSTWLTLALEGLPFPIELSFESFRVLPNGAVVLCAGTFGSMSDEARENLWRYLSSAVSRDPVRMHEALRAQLRRRDPRAGEPDFMQRFKEYAPYRDGNAMGGAYAETLADEVIYHWRTAAREGFGFHEQLLDFYRSLHELTNACRRMLPGGDPLLEGLKDARTGALVRDTRKGLTLEPIRRDWDKYALVFTGLARSVDDLLSDRAWGALGNPESPGTRQEQGGRASNVVVGPLVLGVTALVLSRASASTGPVAGATSLGSTLALAAGVLFLTAALMTDGSA